MLDLADILKTHHAVGIAGNRGTGKTSMALSALEQLRADYPELKIAAFGLNPELNPRLREQNITVLKSVMDILDMRMTNTVIFLDEMALFFDPTTRNKQLGKLQRFFDRIEHLNNRIICATAREGFWNKFMCSRITAFLVKEIEYDALVNGSWLKERVKAINSNSDYRLVAQDNEYYVVTADGGLTTHHTFEYNPAWDTKADLPDLFANKKENKKENQNTKLTAA